MLYIVVVIPMPRAKVTMAATATPGCRNIILKAKRISTRIPYILFLLGALCILQPAVVEPNDPVGNVVVVIVMTDGQNHLATGLQLG